MEASTLYPSINSSPRGAAMALALITAVALSPLYMDRRESRPWSSGGLVLPAVVVGLIAAIKTTAASSSSRNGAHKRAGEFGYSEINDAGFVFRIGSSLGLAGILIMLLCVISWQASVQHFFWR